MYGELRSERFDPPDGALEQFTQRENQYHHRAAKRRDV